jgi:hypothetical protein
MRQWSVLYHSEEIYGSPASICIDERPWWALFVSAATENLDVFVAHKWCNPPGWMGKIALQSGRDDEGYLNHSLADALHAAWHRLATLAEQRAHDRKELPVTEEWLRAHGMAVTIYEVLERQSLD